MRLIFLDIDEVLYTHVPDEDGVVCFGPNPIAINWLRILLHQHTPKIVLVSSWKQVLHFSHKNFIDNVQHSLSFLTPYLYGTKQIGQLSPDKYATAKFTTPTGPYGRDNEIEQWFLKQRMNKEKHNFIIIDDSASAYKLPYYLRRLIPCTHNGFGKEEYQLADTLLTVKTKSTDHEMFMRRRHNRFQRILEIYNG